MEPMTIKTPADVLSFIGHTLGFWPHESLVCITLANNHVGATLRVDLPKPSTENSYAKIVPGYLSHDTSAEGVLFAVYTSEPSSGDHKPHAATIAALTGALAERRLIIRERTPRRRPDSVPVRRRPPDGRPAPPECHPIQPNQRRIRLPRQHHRTPPTASPCRPPQTKAARRTPSLTA